MKEEYVNSFLAPAKMVWDKELGKTLNLAKAEIVSHQFTTEEVTAIIGISGTLQGSVLYGFPEATAEAIVAIMLDGEAGSATDELGLSALGEIANMITGNAATRLASQGFPCDISPGSRFTTLSGPQILATFTSEVGPLTVRISLNETGTRELNATYRPTASAKLGS